ncbi:MAG: hypothetical protein SF066_03105 [Thermoanaerobaculia bacterium]|nr:hypothetical protein [Thermoanaerobaculia bacterium]
MNRTIQTIALGLGATALLLTAIPAVAADSPFSGSFLIGYRTVDVNKTTAKYKEDLNLEDGPRLFSLELEVTPQGPAGEILDTLELALSNYGGDPFETLRFKAAKTGTYKLQYKRLKSDYFYDDTILPKELANVRLSSGGDFHTFDFTRVRDDASLEITVNPQARFTFGYERFTKLGEATTTIDLQRDDFELDRRVNESSNAWRAGYEHSWDKLTVAVEERIEDYENDVELFLPGASAGENTTNFTVLNFFFLDQPYEYQSQQHSLRVVARPTDRWTIRTVASVQNLDLDLTARERSSGIGSTNQPFGTNLSGAGEIGRDLQIFDADVTFRINEAWAVVASIWNRGIDQEGQITFGTATGRSEWTIDSTGYEAGFLWEPSPKFNWTASFRSESRDVEFGAVETATAPFVTEEETTEHDGLVTSLGWRPSERLRFHLSYEDSSYDDSFTLVSPTDRTRLRATGDFRLGGGFTLHGAIQQSDNDNELSGFEGSVEQADLRLSYQKEGFTVAAGWGRTKTEHQIDATIFFGTVPTFLPVNYLSDADFLDGRVAWRGGRWHLGLDLRRYENDGSFAMEREDFRGYVEYDLSERYLVRIAHRTVDYNEIRANFDDYDADITEFGIGYKF